MVVEEVPLHLEQEQGSAFGWREQMFTSYDDKAVYDLSEYEARDIEAMLRVDGKSRALDAVLTLPTRQANWSLKPAKGDAGEADQVQDLFTRAPSAGGMSVPFDLVIGQATGASAYRQAFFEKVWRHTPDGLWNYQKLAWRPQTTCRLRRDPENGSFLGFAQDRFMPTSKQMSTKAGQQQNVVKIDPLYSWVFVNGQHRAPLIGISDLEIPYWCFKTKQKILFLWYSFLEGQTLPKTIVSTDNPTDALKAAQQVATLKGGGVVGLADKVTVQLLESNGHGAAEFQAAIKWLDQSSSGSVLAGFLDLTSMASSGRGSLALSKDASDYYLQSRTAFSVELAASIQAHLVAPLVAFNRGPKAAVPKFEFGPLTEADLAPVQAMVTSLAAAPQMRVPQEFLDQLTMRLAGFLNLDTGLVDAGLKKAAAAAEAAAKTPALAQIAGPVGAVGKAAQAVGAAQTGTADPAKVLAAIKGTQ